MTQEKTARTRRLRGRRGRGGGIKQLYVMKKWAQEVPHEYREGAMNMWRAKTAAYQKPLTIRPKRKRMEVATDAMDGEDDQEDGKSGGDKNEPERGDTARRPKRGKKPRKTRVVTLSRKKWRTGEEPPSVGSRLREIEEE